MIVVVHWVSSIGQEVESIVIIHIAIVVIVNAIVGYFPMVCPHIPLEVWVRVVNAGINDADHHIMRPG